MSSYIEIIAIVEGKTEQLFINSVLTPYLAKKMIFMTATQISKPGQKGGNVEFRRLKDDLEIHLKQRKNTFVTTFIDYYGIREWPGVGQVPNQATPSQIADTINQATTLAVNELFSEFNSKFRFIPYIAVHEFESLLFSDSQILSSTLGIAEDKVLAVLTECGEPEAINNSPQTAPSKRLQQWSTNGKFPKTTMGIMIAQTIGINRIREKCPLFNDWLNRIESLIPLNHHHNR
jgi:hypothetical protein